MIFLFLFCLPVYWFIPLIHTFVLIILIIPSVLKWNDVSILTTGQWQIICLFVYHLICLLTYLLIYLYICLFIHCVSCFAFWMLLINDVKTFHQSLSELICPYLLQAKERELELKNQWADNRMTRKQTQAKYGFWASLSFYCHTSNTMDSQFIMPLVATYM